MWQMQEKNIGHICPIGRSRVKHTKLHHYKKNVLGAYPLANCIDLGNAVLQIWKIFLAPTL